MVAECGRRIGTPRRLRRFAVRGVGRETATKRTASRTRRRGDPVMVGIGAEPEGGLAREPGGRVGDEAVPVGDEVIARRDCPCAGGRGVQERLERYGADIERDIREEALPDFFPAREAALVVLRMAECVVGRPAELFEGGRGLVRVDAVDRGPVE